MIIKKNVILAIVIAGLLLALLPTKTYALTIQDGIVSGIIWEDVNTNDIQEISEHGLAGIKIYIKSQVTNEIFTTESLEGGGFTFFDLVSGYYQLWYEHDNTNSEIFDVEIDELSGIASIKIPMSTSMLVNSPITPANIAHNHIVFLPIIIR